MAGFVWRTDSEKFHARTGNQRFGVMSRFYPRTYLVPDPDPGHSSRYAPMVWHWLVFR